jgi:hypothetical protein
VADCGEDDVGRIALATLEMTAAEVVNASPSDRGGGGRKPKSRNNPMQSNCTCSRTWRMASASHGGSYAKQIAFRSSTTLARWPGQQLAPSPVYSKHAKNSIIVFPWRFRNMRPVQHLLFRLGVLLPAAARLHITRMPCDRSYSGPFMSVVGRFCCRTILRSRANRDSVEVKRPSTESFDDGAVQG